MNLHMSPYISGNRTSFRLDYLDVLRSFLYQYFRLYSGSPLSSSSRNKQDYQQTIAPILSGIDFMNEYGLDYEDIIETMVNVSFPDAVIPYSLCNPTDFQQKIQEIKSILHKEYNRRGLYFEVLSTHSKGTKSSSKLSKQINKISRMETLDNVAISMFGGEISSLGHNEEDEGETEDDRAGKDMTSNSIEAEPLKEYPSAETAASDQDEEIDTSFDYDTEETDNEK